MRLKSLAALLVLVACSQPVKKSDAGPEDMDAGITGIISTLASGQNDPVTMTLENGTLYWASYTAPGGAILSISTAGAASPTVVQPSQSYPYSVATDANNVYWLNFGTYDGSDNYNMDGAVLKSPLAGGSAPVTLATPRDGPNGIAVAGNSVYWIDIGEPDSAGNYPEGLVLSVPIAGGDVTTLATNQSYPYAIAADTGHVYWANAGSFDSITTRYNHDGALMRVDLSGNAVTTLASAQEFPTGVTVDANNVYWTAAGPPAQTGGPNANTGYIAKTPIGGGSITTLAQYQNAPIAIVVDSVHACWVNGGAQNVDGSIAFVPVGGGTPATIVANLKNPIGIAVSPDDGHVYWTEAGTNGTDGAVVAFTRQ